MAGGSRQHAALAVAVSAALHQQLRDKPCVVHSSDLKVRVLETGLATYPDVTIISGPAEEDPLSRHVVLNPALVVEVTSPSTEDWDRGEKAEHYRKIPRLEGCVLVSHRERQITLVSRQADGSWNQNIAGPGESVALRFLDCKIQENEIPSREETPHRAALSS